MQNFASVLQRGGILRDGNPRPKPRRLLKGGKYAPLKKEPRRGQGPPGNEKVQALHENWEKKKFRKTKKWPAKGLGGYVADEDEITPEIHKEANDLQRSTFLLREYLKRPAFIHACDDTGVRPLDLLPKPMEDFQRAENRAFDRTFQEQHAAYLDHEEYRCSLIRKVLLSERRLKEKFKKKVALLEKEKKQMSHLLEVSIVEERKRMAQMEKVASKIQRAKNYQQEAIAKEAKRRQEELAKREHRASKTLKKRQLKLKKTLKTKAAERHRRQEAAAEAREAKAERLAAQALEMKHKQQLRMQELNDKMQKQKAEFLASRRTAKNLAGVRAEREAERQAELRRVQEEKLAAKEALIQKLKADKDREAKVRSLKASLQFERRKKQAERIRKAQVRQVAALQRQLEIRDKRAFALKEIRTAIAIERNSVLRDAQISLDEWRATNKMPLSATEPGPGEYNLPDVFAKHRAGVADEGWSKRPKPKSEFELAADRAREIPAPGDYGEIDDPRNSSFHTTGGEWGDYEKPKSEFQMAMDRANDTPAAQDYDPTPLKSNVGSVNMNGEKPLDTPLDLTIRRANDTPAPDTYAKPASPPRMRDLATLRAQLNVSVNVLGFISKLKSKQRKRKDEADSNDGADSGEVVKGPASPTAKTVKSVQSFKS